MKKIYAAVALAMALGTKADAQIMRIETASGEQKVYDLSKVKSVSFSDETNTEALTTMEVVNASPLAFDLKVTKSASCQKYMVAVQPQSTYREADFTFAAEQTLDKNAYYRPYAATLRYESDIFSETQLGLNSLTDADGKAQTLVAAVYAVDDLGTVQVSSQEFTLPTTYDYGSTIKMKIETGDVAYNHVTYTIKPSGWTRPAKILYGVTQPDWMKTTLEAFNKKSDTGKRDFLIKQGLGLPMAYTGNITQTVDCSASSDIIIYAMPIDDKGRLGETTIVTLTTPAPEANGTGTFTGLSYLGESKGEDDFYGKANFTVSTEGAVAYRLLWMESSEYADNDYKKDLVSTFLNERLGTYGVWEQFPADGSTASLDIVRPGHEYVLYGVTVDSKGNISEPVNLLDAYYEAGTITTTPKTDED